MAEETQSPEPEVLPGSGTEHGELLQQAHDAFVQGDYASVRSLTEKLEGAEDDVAMAAEQLRRRVSSDPAQWGVLAACVLFFLFIAWKYVL